jgi:hypothetical protein
MDQETKAVLLSVVKAFSSLDYARQAESHHELTLQWYKSSLEKVREGEAVGCKSEGLEEMMREGIKDEEEELKKAQDRIGNLHNEITSLRMTLEGKTPEEIKEAFAMMDAAAAGLDKVVFGNLRK